MKQYQNIKNQISKIKNLLKRLNFLLAILLVTFLFLNLVGSQLISPIYSQFVNNDKRGTVAFLQKIKNLPNYQEVLEMNNNIYGNTVKDEIYKAENQEKFLINKLEQELTINMKARDVLFSLYKLNLAEGNKNKANEYLKRAREVDPDIRL